MIILICLLIGFVLGLFLKDLILGAVFKAYDWIKGKF